MPFACLGSFARRCTVPQRSKARTPSACRADRVEACAVLAALLLPFVDSAYTVRTLGANVHSTLVLRLAVRQAACRRGRAEQGGSPSCVRGDRSRHLERVEWHGAASPVPRSAGGSIGPLDYTRSALVCLMNESGTSSLGHMASRTGQDASVYAIRLRGPFRVVLCMILTVLCNVQEQVWGCLKSLEMIL